MRETVVVFFIYDKEDKSFLFLNLDYAFYCFISTEG